MNANCDRFDIEFISFTPSEYGSHSVRTTYSQQNALCCQDEDTDLAYECKDGVDSPNNKLFSSNPCSLGYMFGGVSKRNSMSDCPVCDIV